jgi:cytidyltransferase-like protein
MKRAVVSGGFDVLRSRHVRFLQEAGRFGELHVLLWSDQVIRDLTGEAPTYPLNERIYLLQSIRYVTDLTVVSRVIEPDELPQVDGLHPDVWVVDEDSDNARKRSYCDAHGLGYGVVKESELQGFPLDTFEPKQAPASHKKAIVTGCFDWLHSGHVRFFEEVAGLGDLYVVVGHDDNIRLLKGDGHPLFSQDERRYMVQSIRYVTAALISSGHGWMDAEPEIDYIKPDIYAVNEDGDKLEKRAFCEQHGIQYVVLKRTPKEGLPRRESTELRGF